MNFVKFRSIKETQICHLAVLTLWVVGLCLISKNNCNPPKKGSLQLCQLSSDRELDYNQQVIACWQEEITKTLFVTTQQTVDCYRAPELDVDKKFYASFQHNSKIAHQVERMNARRVRETISRLTLVFYVLNTVGLSIVKPQFVLANKENEFHRNKMDRALQEESEHERESCASTRRVKRHDHARFPLSPPSGTKFGKALQFTGREAVRFKDVKIPSTFRQFTVDFWIKPEGGQHSPVTILGLFDNCSPPDVRDSGWKIGLADESTQKVEENLARNLRVFFSLRTQRASFNTTIFSVSKVQANVWTHVAANYDGRKMRLFINQAQEAASKEQKGRIFGDPHGENTDKNVYAPDLCESLEGGGDRFTNIFFRGTFDELRLWGVAKPHKNITNDAFVLITPNDKSVLFYEGFSSPLRRWVPVTEKSAEILKSTIPSEAHDLSIHKPPCGNTVCDNPEVVKSYLANRERSGHKILRYRVVNVMKDDGSDPTVTTEQIQRQHQILRDAFSPYNITWQLNVVEIKNTSLRYRTTLYLCEAEMIGDGRCNEDCNFAVTGYDGGDCHRPRRLSCNAKRHQNNGKCDPECNSYYATRPMEWDSGECCDPRITDTSKTCFDPKSPHRAYVSVREYKSIINLENREFLNVYFARWTKRTIQGIATFPWDKTVHSVEGGVVLDPKSYGASHAIIHEFGHALGLFHVHHGVSAMKCTDECYESFPSLELGDLCSDTNPTPENDACGDPKSKKNPEMFCGTSQFKDTPYSNFMSYSDDKCTESFTPQQSARMHCYVDLMYQSWQPVATTPSFIPLPPRIISENPQGVTLSWIPPLGTGGSNAINKCHECWENSIFQQFAVTAWSPNPAKPSGNWAPHQAIGAQDAQPCSASPRAWLPETRSCPDCYIELGFKKAVIPSRLSIWVPYNPKDGIRDTQLIFSDKTEKSLGNATAQCDEPLTIPIKTNKKVMKVRIHLRKPYVSIDAVRLTSSVDHPNCRKCRDVYYKVSRDPPFPSSKDVVDGKAVVKIPNFLDRNIESGVTYRYHVQAVISSSVKSAGAPSPSLFYTPKRGFCGDGKVDEKNGEECDDGNVRDGDGCNVRCKKEDVFHCKGHPSLCYRYDGDGVCEEFEKTISIKDCGFYTPKGFADQWAVKSVANRRKQQDDCAAVDVVNGPPPRDLVCKPEPDPGTSWRPCHHRRPYWLEVTFKTPVVASAVVLYLASDGRSIYDTDIKTVRVEVADKNNQYYSSGGEVALACKTNPATIPIHHDMSKPFFYTQKVRIYFRSESIAIAGVALRHSKIFNPVALQNCKPGQMFNPLTQQCHDYTCTVPSCKELELEHADITCQGRKEGQICSVTCKRGYRPAKQFQMTCLQGQWVDRVTHMKRCAPANCGKPKIRNGVAVCREGTTFGKKCTFTCKPDAKMASGENVIECEEDARWSSPAAHCSKTCPEPAIPRHSKQIDQQCIGNKARGVAPFTPGMTCKFRCQEGYRTIHKGKYSKKIIRLRCKKSGRWSGEGCEVITCKEPSPYILAFYNCTKKNMFGSKCTFNCPGEKNEVIMCGPEGLWDGKFRKCPTAGHCDRPKNIASVTFACGNLEPGSKCKAKCNKKGFEAAIRGMEDKWIVSTTCTTRLKWFPDPSKIYCLPRCNQKKVGDTYCDRVNNNKHCRYDGGDCCKSTLKDGHGMVLPYPSDCDMETDCNCKDPRAIENRNDRPGPDDEDEDSGSGRNYMTTEEVQKKKI